MYGGSTIMNRCKGLLCLTVLSTIFQVVSVIGGGNQSTRRKPLIGPKSLTNFIT